MARDFNNNTKNNDEWLTPPHIVEALGVFDLDPCSPKPDVRPWATASNHFCVDDDGLNQRWRGRVWCNPPYGREAFDWLKELAHHGNGIALIFARTETKGFHSEVWGKADAIFFFKGRLKFHYIDGRQGDTANAPSCLIAYGDNNVEALKGSGLCGVLVDLRK